MDIWSGWNIEECLGDVEERLQTKEKTKLWTLLFNAITGVEWKLSVPALMGVCLPPWISGQLGITIVRLWSYHTTHFESHLLGGSAFPPIWPKCATNPVMLCENSNELVTNGWRIKLPLLEYTPFFEGPSLWRLPTTPLEYSLFCCDRAWSPGNLQSWSCPPCPACKIWALWSWGTCPSFSWSLSARPLSRSDPIWWKWDWRILYLRACQKSHLAYK